MTTAQEIRPKVYADPDGCEWRCVEGRLQARDWEYGEDPDDASEARMADEFTPSGFASDSEWAKFIVSQYPRSLAALQAAQANPMTADEAKMDDALIGADDMTHMASADEMPDVDPDLHRDEFYDIPLSSDDR